MRGFTLIELLIVVAIIAILALIALPNFLEAQIRAKTARVQSDQRAISVGLETYAVDNNIYPPRNAAPGSNGFWQRQLTTPIAYLSGVFSDVFCRDDSIANRYYQYAHCAKMYSYILVSVGPDTVDDFDDDMWMCPMASTYPIHYDPTNGAASQGDIWRISKQGGCCPVPYPR